MANVPPPTPLASLSLTHVYYNPDDPISLFCAYLALLPQTLCVVYATLILATREAEIALLFAGQLGCEALNFCLKRLIKQDRPLRVPGEGYGMPSSHAQFVAFWSLSLALFLLLRHEPTQSPGRASKGVTHSPWSFAECLAVSLAALLITGLTAWSRLYLDYHTPLQVFYGTALGAASAVAWFIATALLRRSGWLARALDTTLARSVRARDLILGEDVCQAGWEKWEKERCANIASEAANRKER